MLLFTRYYLVDRIKEDEMGGPVVLRVKMRWVILKLIFDKWGVMMWTGFI
jgi:hypothetical protein